MNKFIIFRNLFLAFITVGVLVFGYFTIAKPMMERQAVVKKVDAEWYKWVKSLDRYIY